MKLKTKIFLGIVFLFVQLAAVSGVSVNYSYDIADRSKALFVDNIRSIQYCGEMRRDMDTINTYLALGMGGYRRFGKEITAHLQSIVRNIENEKNNITETNEREYVESLERNFTEFNRLINPVSRQINAKIYETKIIPVYRRTVDDIEKINSLNLMAVNEKRAQIAEYEYRYYVIISIITTLCVIVSFSFLFSFPNIVDRNRVGR
jgi:hypothetical protein